jgi:uncharacterized protein with HEPN domain
MSKNRDIDDYIEDILIAISDVEAFIKDMSYETFAQDKKTINAVIRSLEVIGEATKRIPKPVRQKYPNIPWDKMAGMRDVLIHDYMGVDLKTVWKVAQDRLRDLKPLLEKFRNMLRNAEEDIKQGRYRIIK